MSMKEIGELKDGREIYDAIQNAIDPSAVEVQRFSNGTISSIVIILFFSKLKLFFFTQFFCPLLELLCVYIFRASEANLKRLCFSPQCYLSKSQKEAVFEHKQKKQALEQDKLMRKFQNQWQKIVEEEVREKCLFA